jgi:hypothetical protein
VCLCQDATDPGEKSTPKRKRKVVKEVNEEDTAQDRPLIKEKKGKKAV